MPVEELSSNLQDGVGKYANDITSQSGEDGILRRIFDLIPGDDRWCCEFGAWDGKKCSNTHQLILNDNWSGVLIEADQRKCEVLRRTYCDNKKVDLINKFVTYDGEDVLDNILSGTTIPKDFDLLSIDIDGNDYHVWAAFEQYKPKAVIIEYNQSIPNHIEFIQEANPKTNHGSSLLSINKLAKSKGYELIAVTDLNAIFVRSDYYYLFNLTDNGVNAMRPYSPYVTDIFQLYDGTIVLSGNKKMIWHNVPMASYKFQVLPKCLRKFPGVMGKFQLLTLGFWKLLLGCYKRALFKSH